MGRRLIDTALMPDFSGVSLQRGRFRLLESLGTGSYGKVYRAIDNAASLSNQNVFAIKCLNKPKRGSNTEVLHQREFAHHKLVSGHPNIIGFHHDFSDGLFVYVVLDFFPGGDLFGAIAEKHIFRNNDQLIKQVFIQLIDAVQYCHSLGVFHRDIKPENVLCSDDGTDVRLADFGLSIMSPVSEDFGCGSSFYMSPECIGYDVVWSMYSTRHNDIWALGVILVNMITVQNPWRHATSRDGCFNRYLYNNDFIYEVLPISREVNAILKKVFTLNPLGRISLPDLRLAVLQTNEFYVKKESPTTTELEAYGGVVDIHESVQPKKQLGDQESLCAGPADSLISSTDSDEHYIFPSPVADYPPAQTPVHMQLGPILKSSNPEDFTIIGSTDSLAVPPFASSGSSGLESNGPITPATYPVDVDPPVDIPDIPDEEGLGPPADLTTAVVVGKFKPPGPISKSKRAGDIFRMAVQRIKALSSSVSSS